MDIEKLKYNLKVMIIDECEKEDITPQDIQNDAELFAPDNALELDSLDALQISMGVQKAYNIRLVDPKEFRRVVTTIDNLAAFIYEKNA